MFEYFRCALFVVTCIPMQEVHKYYANSMDFGKVRECCVDKQICQVCLTYLCVC